MYNLKTGGKYIMDIFEYCHHPSFWAPVDSWFPLQNEIIFKQTKNAIILPVYEFYGCDNSMVLDNFKLKKKRCYKRK